MSTTERREGRERSMCKCGHGYSWHSRAEGDRFKLTGPCTYEGCTCKTYTDKKQASKMSDRTREQAIAELHDEYLKAKGGFPLMEYGLRAYDLGKQAGHDAGATCPQCESGRLTFQRRYSIVLCQQCESEFDVSDWKDFGQFFRMRKVLNGDM